MIEALSLHHHHGETAHGHTHGPIDPAIATSERGLRAVQWSLFGLLVTAILQAAIVAVVVVIFLSASITAYKSVERIYHPQSVDYLGALALAGLLGFVGNEAMAIYRMPIGHEINSQL